jgi:hypothetical protein
LTEQAFLLMELVDMLLVIVETLLVCFLALVNSFSSLLTFFPVSHESATAFRNWKWVSILFFWVFQTKR